MSGEENQEKRKIEAENVIIKKTRLDIEDNKHVDGQTTEDLFKKYENMSRTDLEELCERLIVYDSQGIYIPPDKFKLNCQNKKQKHKTRKLQKHSSKEVNPKFGEGNVGLATERFGHKSCSCCNQPDEHIQLDNLIPNLADSLNLIKHEPSLASSQSLEQQEPSCSHSNSPTASNIEDLSKPSCSGLQQIQNPMAADISLIDLDTDTDNYELSDTDFNQINSDLYNILNPSTRNSILNEPVPMQNETIIDLGDSFVAPTTPDVINLTNTPTPITPGLIIDLVNDPPRRTRITSAPIETIDLVDSDTEHNEPTAKSPVTKPVLECPICLESLKNKKIMSTTCGHIFCSRCIRNVVKKTKSCPNCRKKLNVSSIHPLYVNF